MKIRQSGQNAMGCIKYFSLGLFAILAPGHSMAAPFGLWINANSTNSYSGASQMLVPPSLQHDAFLD